MTVATLPTGIYMHVCKQGNCKLTWPDALLSRTQVESVSALRFHTIGGTGSMREEASRCPRIFLKVHS